MSLPFNLKQTFLSPALLLSLILVCLFLVSCGEDEEGEQPTQVVSEQKGSLIDHGIVPDISGEGAADLAQVFLDLHEDIIGAIWHDMKDNIQREFDKNGVPLTVDEYVQKYMWQEGEFVVTPMDDHYNVAFPSKTVIILPKDGKLAQDINNPENTRVEVTHLYSLEARPTGDPNVWKYKLNPIQKPFSVTVIEEGIPYEVMSITMDVKKAEGLWHTQLQNAVQLDSKVFDFEVKLSWPRQLATGEMKERIRNSGNDSVDFVITAGVLESIGKMEPDEENLWSGTINSNMTNIAVALPEGLGSFTAYSMDVTQTADKLDPASYALFQDEYRDFLKFVRNHPSVSSPDLAQGESNMEAQTAAKEAVGDLLKDVRVFLQNGLQGMEAIVDVKDLRYLAPADPAAPDDRAPAFEMDRIRMASRASGLQTDAATLGMQYQMKGFSIDPAILNRIPSMAAVPLEVFPKNIQIGGYVENVPIQKFLAMLDEYLESTPVTGEDTHKPFPALSSDQVLAILKESGASIHVDQNYIGNDIWLVSVDGQGQVNPAAIYNMTGALDIRTYGLDTLLASLNKRAGAEQDLLLQRTLRGTLSALTFVQAFGQQKEDAQNRPYRGYMLNITEDGKVQLNGTDIRQMMGAMGVGGTSAPQPRPSTPPSQVTPAQ